MLSDYRVAYTWLALIFSKIWKHKRATTANFRMIAYLRHPIILKEKLCRCPHQTLYMAIGWYKLGWNWFSEKSETLDGRHSQFSDNCIFDDVRSFKGDLRILHIQTCYMDIGWQKLVKYWISSNLKKDGHHSLFSENLVRASAVKPFTPSLPNKIKPPVHHQNNDAHGGLGWSNHMTMSHGMHLTNSYSLGEIILIRSWVALCPIYPTYMHIFTMQHNIHLDKTSNIWSKYWV